MATEYLCFLHLFAVTTKFFDDFSSLHYTGLESQSAKGVSSCVSVL